MRRWLLVATTALVVASGCRSTPPDDVFACTTMEDCPPGFFCVEGFCRTEAPDGGAPDACVPRGCEADECGFVPDGCAEGTFVMCTSCPDGERCRADRCEPVCEIVDCDSRCGEVVTSCASVQCGGCPGDEVCVDGECQPCAPATACRPSEDCGDRSDGCGGTLECGTCDEGLFCGGGGPNVCGDEPCTPVPCPADACGTISDGCDRTLSCGTCAGADEVCEDNACVCPAPSCAGGRCGRIENACGQISECGGCAVRELCVESQCESCVDPHEPNETQDDASEHGPINAGGFGPPIDASLHDAEDVDWMAFDETTASTITARIEGIPEGARYNLAVVVSCPDDINVPVTCSLGGSVAVPGASGCSADVGEDAEITLSGVCPAGARRRVFVRVLADRWGDCDSHRILIRAN